MERNVYISEYVDSARCHEYAREYQRKGDRVWVHEHSYDVPCLFRQHELYDGTDDAAST